MPVAHRIRGQTTASPCRAQRPLRSSLFAPGRSLLDPHCAARRLFCHLPCILSLSSLPSRHDPAIAAAQPGRHSRHLRVCLALPLPPVGTNAIRPAPIFTAASLLPATRSTGLAGEEPRRVRGLESPCEQRARPARMSPRQATEADPGHAREQNRTAAGTEPSARSARALCSWR